jgi:LysM repeat protein
VYLVLNAIVSATVTLSVLWWWDRTHPAGASTPALTFTATPPAAVAANTQASEAEPTSGGATTAVLPTPTIYVVKSGDSLGSIAQQYQVSVEDIMAANNLTDPNVLNVGLSLIIPVAGSVPPTAEPGSGEPAATTVVEPPRPTATRDPSVAPPRLTIREVTAAGDLAEERLVIINDGGPVDLAGWSLRDETGHSYTFPALMLFEDGAVTVHTRAGTDTVTDLYWGQAEAVWVADSEALLSDAGGNLHARLAIP